MASTLELLRRLAAEKADFLLVGGMAAVVHGSTSVTQDVDVWVRFDERTLRAVFRALEGTHPRQRMHPAAPPVSDPLQFVGHRNLYLVTDEGVLDLLGELTGLGPYEEAANRAVSVDLGGFSCKVLGLDDLITSKRAVGRAKDLHVARELEAVRRARDVSR